MTRAGLQAGPPHVWDSGPGTCDMLDTADLWGPHGLLPAGRWDGNGAQWRKEVSGAGGRASAGPLGAVSASLRGAVVDVGKSRVTGCSDSHLVFRPLCLQRAASACFFGTVHLRREGGLSVSLDKVTVAILCCLKLTFSLFLK